MLFVIVGGLQAQKINDATFEKLVLKKMTEFPLETQFSIAYISDGEVMYEGVIHKPSGVERIDNADDIFEIGSVTKVFTSYLLSTAVQDKKIDLDDNIYDLLESEEKNQPKITYEQLSNHTAGLYPLPSNYLKYIKDRDNPYESYGEEQLVEYLNEKVALMNTPNKAYNYSNIGVGILGYSVSRLYDGDYRSVLQRKILNPLGMQSTYMSPMDVKENLVGGLDADGEPTVCLLYTSPSPRDRTRSRMPSSA